jgi:eukaryotic-like serine/threonine-protein kinase
VASQLPKLPKDGDLIDGRFRAMEMLGTGGFGTVYRALQENVGRDVALKFLTPGVAKDPVNVERFRREAFHISQLRHPNTITLYDYGQTSEGLIYMVMELLEGTSLSDAIQNDGALEQDRAIHVFIQVLKSLSEAHQRGIVHRDLKPENIFLCEMFGEQDYVKVLDFGVAKMTMEEGDDGVEDKLTKAGRIFGTPMYMAPEQACAEPITPATDVYALGLLLFEILSGLPPVTGRNRMDVIHKQIRDPVPVLTDELNGTPIGDFIRKACEKEPSARFHNASQMLDHLVPVIRAMNIVPRPRGATHPEISVNTLVPVGLLDVDGTGSSVKRPPLPVKSEVQNHLAKGPLGRPSEVSAPDAETTIREALKPSDSSQGIPRKPEVSSERPRASRPKMPQPPVAVEAQSGSDTADQSSLMERLADKERSRNLQGQVHEASATGTPIRLPLTGREKDVLKLCDLMHGRLVEKTGFVVLLEGESGVGKTRVVEALRSHMRNVDVDLCVGFGRRRSLPLEEIREALADLLGVAQMGRREVKGKITAELTGAGVDADEEVEFLTGFVRPRVTEHGQSLDDTGVLFARLERLIMKLSERRPLVLVLEDVQNVGSDTLAFLEYIAVALRTQSCRLAICLTFRPEAMSTNPNLERSLRTVASNIGPSLTRYVLKRLRGQDLSDLIDVVLPLEAQLHSRVSWLSQGIPLHAIQIVRYLQGQGALVQEGSVWTLRRGTPREMNLPPDLMDLMRLRVEQALSKFGDRPALRAALEWLAVLGLRTPVELLTAVLQAGVGGLSVEDDLAALRQESVVHQVMHRNLPCVEFDNSLLREAILRDLSERWASRRLHRTAAERKIDFYRSRDMEIPLIEIADHWRQSGELEKYRDTIFAAAERSMRRRDLRGGRQQFRELVHVLESRSDRGQLWIHTQLALADIASTLGEFGLAADHYQKTLAQKPAQVSDEAQAIRGMAELSVKQRRLDEAAHYFEQAMDLVEESGDAEDRVKALVGLSKVFMLKADRASEESIRGRLLDDLPSLPDGATKGHALMQLSEVAKRLGNLDSRRDYLVRAQKQFQVARDRQGLSDVLLQLGNALMSPSLEDTNRLERSGKILGQALELKRALGDRFGVAEAFRFLGQLKIESDESVEGVELLNRALSIHEALRTPFSIGATHNSLAGAKFFLRDFAGAQAHWETALEIFERLGDSIAVSHTLMNLGELAMNQRDIERAKVLLNEAREMKESMGSSWAVYDIRNHLSVLHLWSGEFEEAERLLDETLRTVDEWGTGEDRAVARSLMGLLRCVQSRLQLAALELGRARADAEDLGMERVAAFCRANAAFYSGLTQSQTTFDELIDSVRNTEFLYTMERGFWLDLVARVAVQAAERTHDRQSVRLLFTAGLCLKALGNERDHDAMIDRARRLDKMIDTRP